MFRRKPERLKDADATYRRIRGPLRAMRSRRKGLAFGGRKSLPRIDTGVGYASRPEVHLYGVARRSQDLDAPLVGLENRRLEMELVEVPCSYCEQSRHCPFCHGGGRTATGVCRYCEGGGVCPQYGGTGSIEDERPVRSR